MDSEELKTVLSEKVPSEEDLNSIRNLLLQSQDSRLREKSKNIETAMRSNPQSESLVLMIDAKEELLLQRAQIITKISERVVQDHDISAFLPVLSQTAWGWSESEILPVFSPLLQEGVRQLRLDSKDQRAQQVFFLAVDTLSKKGVFNKLEKSVQIEALSSLKEVSSVDVDFGPGPLAKRALVALDVDYANELLEKLARISRTSTDLTEVADAMPEYLRLLAIRPSVQYIDEIKGIAENIARFKHNKLRNVFFKSLGDLKIKLSKTNEDLSAKLDAVILSIGTMGDNDWRQQFAQMQERVALLKKKRPNEGD